MVIQSLYLSLQIAAAVVLTWGVHCLNVLCWIGNFFWSRKKINIVPSRSIVVITGCDTGFGELASRRLASMGYQVVSVCLTEDGAKRLSGVCALSLKCDVTNDQDVKKLAEAVSRLCDQSNHQLWCVINNAGIALNGCVDWVSVDSIRRTMDVNYFGVVAVTKSLLPLLKKCHDSRIVTVSSLAGFCGAPMMSAYCASKHAVEGFMKSLRVEMRPWNIHVSTIAPGFFATPIVSTASDISRKLYQDAPEDVRAMYDPEDVIRFGKSEIAKMMLENPSVVVDTMVHSVTCASPPMWYFPGIQSNCIRFMTNINSEFLDAFWFLLRYAVPQPTPQAKKKYGL